MLGLLALLFGLAVWYGTLAPTPALGAYPTEDNLNADYNLYLGNHVTVGGRAVTTDPVVIRAENSAGNTIRLAVTDLTVNPTVGDHLRVFGVVEGKQTIRASNALTVPQWGHWYTWSVSFLAGLWVLARLIRYWYLNLSDWTFTPRDTPVASHFGARVRTHFQNRGD